MKNKQSPSPQSDIIHAIKLCRAFNAMSVREIDWDIYFDGEEVKLMVDHFALSGLNNTDLLTSNFSDGFRVKRKYEN